MVQLSKVSIFTPVLSSENPWIRFPALYLSPFSRMQAIRIETMEKIGDSKGVVEEQHRASLTSTALKISSYILTLGILPLLSLIALMVIRSVHKFHWVQTSPTPIIAFATAEQVKPQTPPQQPVSPNLPNKPSPPLQARLDEKDEQTKPQPVSPNPPNKPSPALQARLNEIDAESRKTKESIQRESDERKKKIKQEYNEQLAKLAAQGTGKDSVNRELGVIFDKHVKAIRAKDANDPDFQKNLKEMQDCINAVGGELGRLWAMNANNTIETMANGRALVEMSLANVNVQNPHLSSEEIANVKKAFFMEKAKYYIGLVKLIKEQEQKKGGSAGTAVHLINLLNPLADGSCPLLQSKHLDQQKGAVP